MAEHDYPFVQFNIKTCADAGILDRLFSPFSRRSIIIEQVSAEMSGEVFFVQIRAQNLCMDTVRLIEGNLRQNILVSDVEVSISHYCAAKAA